MARSSRLNQSEVGTKDESETYKPGKQEASRDQRESGTNGLFVGNR